MGYPAAVSTPQDPPKTPSTADSADPFVAFYPVIREMAARAMSRERRDHTLQATALANEAYMKLRSQSPGTLSSESELRAMVAVTMKHLLIDHARAKAAIKRQPVTRSGISHGFHQDPLEDLSLKTSIGKALSGLQRLSPQQADILSMAVLAGMRYSEIAHVCGISETTVKREIRRGKSMMRAMLAEEFE